ncbi:MAG: cytoplasmic protein, partial [Polyangiaceae bacterium]|nr:cytoplasmic protein [Polyangiaceae bacterium]
CGLIGVRREDLPYLRMGQERGLGTTSWETLRTVEV